MLVVKTWGGSLDLSDFVNLESLSCQSNHLTKLNIINCRNLIELNCSWNELTNLDINSVCLQVLDCSYNFLTELEWEKFNPETLKSLSIEGNNFFPSDLSVFSRFINLKGLWIGDYYDEKKIQQDIYNKFYGSLEPLRNLNNLEHLNINNTDVDSGLEYLPISCKKLVCNSNPPNKIMEELNKSECSEEDSYNKKYYNLDKWRETNKQNNLTASAIPLERLFVIRSNIKKYIDKWGKEENYSWYELSSWKQTKKEIALSRLQNPNDYSKSWWTITGIQWTNRATLVVGGGLVLIGQSDTSDPNSQLYTQIGGVIAIVGPFVETVTSYVNDQIYDAKQKKWDEFISDTENLLDNYHELLGILEQVKVSELGKVNEALNDLRTKTQLFLKRYDKDENRAIDISELIEGRRELATDLNKEKKESNTSQLNNIVLAIKILEGEVINCRQGVWEEKLETPKQEKLSKENKLSQKENFQTIDLDEYFEGKIEIAPKKN